MTSLRELKGRASHDLAAGPDLSDRAEAPSFKVKPVSNHNTSGSLLSTTETAGAKPVVVINETMAKRFWAGKSAVGQSIQDGVSVPRLEIVGVVRDIKYYTLGEEPRPHASPSGRRQSRAAFGESVRREIESLDRNVVASVMTVSELHEAPLFPVGAMALVSTLFGALALLLTAVGLYGVVSYAVSRRTHEIGVRMALGAAGPDILRLVVGHGLLLAGAGLALEIAASAAAARLLAGLLFGVSPHDPATLAGMSHLFASVALVACYIPARRATRVDPLRALRHD